MRESSNQGECRHTLDGVFAGLLEAASRGLWQLMHPVELFESLEYFLKHSFVGSQCIERGLLLTTCRNPSGRFSSITCLE